MRRILVTSALPYANYHIHLGHMLEHVQTDIWARFQRLQGNTVAHICADDTHGTAITIRAQKEGRSEVSVITEMSAAHQRDFAGFGIQFDHYGSTHAESNRALCTEFWAALRKADLIVERDVSQLFDVQAGMFLADRFVTGTCPKCSSKNQYGDNCEVCSSTYSPTDLIDPVSALTGSRPEVRSSKHLFVTIERFHEFLDQWTQSGEHLQPGIANYLKGFFLAEPLKDWDVSRPAPYFGFEISDSPGNYWYVWFDAPIGYVAATQDWCEKTAQNLRDWWLSPNTEIHHFIGKDITYFHTLFWPTMLKAAGYTLPTRVNVHGFLTVNGEKMSKSRGTFILASTYLSHLDPAYLRYYYASKLSSKADDIDLDIVDFVAKVNGDLVGKVVNLASRTARFVENTALATEYPDDGGLFEAGAQAGKEIAEAYESVDYSRAMRIIMALADKANEYVDREKPWALKKQGDRAEQLVSVCTVALNLYRQLVIYLTPVLPELTRQSAAFLGAELTHWSQAQAPLLASKITKFEHLLERADIKKFEALIAAGASDVAAAEATPKAAKQNVKNASFPSQAESVKPQSIGAAVSDESNKGEATSTVGEVDYGQELILEPLAPECSIEEFSKVDLRIAEIVAAEEVPEAKKLLKLTVSLGGQIRRTVFAGIKAAYEPKDLVGRYVVIVANLKPRKMKFGLSEGMVLAAGPGEKDVFVLAADRGAKPGQRVH